MLKKDNSVLEETVSALQQCIKEGLEFSEFKQLYDQIIKVLPFDDQNEVPSENKNDTFSEIQEEFFFSDEECN